MERDTSLYQGIPRVGNTIDPLVVLVSVNAGYSHANLGLRYLMANMGDLESNTCILEGTRRLGIPVLAEAVGSLSPKIVGISVSIWNHKESQELAAAIRTRLPGTWIVFGGPEASHLPENHPLFGSGDLVLRGEGDLAFAPLVLELLDQGSTSTWKPGKRIQSREAALPELDQIRLPYRLLGEGDLKNRLIYVETSRGCPFSCEFCLSGVTDGVRYFPLEPVLQEIQELYNRGGRYFKVIDRTFNQKIERASRTLEFFLRLLSEGKNPGAYVQFEVVPDRFPGALREIVARFPPETLRLEVGIQTFDNDTATRIRRRQNQQKTQENLEFLLRHTSAVVHADLIIGLPGEDLASFARGFDQLYALGPAETQLGILKALPGTSLHRHDAEWGMVYKPEPPYEVIQTAGISREEMDRLKIGAKFWELLANRGRYSELLEALVPRRTGAFYTFLELSDFLFRRLGRTWGIDSEEFRLLLMEKLRENPIVVE